MFIAWEFFARNYYKFCSTCYSAHANITYGIMVKKGIAVTGA
jgi:hypothetical protein